MAKWPAACFLSGPLLAAQTASATINVRHDTIVIRTSYHRCQWHRRSRWLTPKKAMKTPSTSSFRTSDFSNAILPLSAFTFYLASACSWIARGTAVSPTQLAATDIPTADRSLSARCDLPYARPMLRHATVIGLTVASILFHFEMALKASR